MKFRDRAGNQWEEVSSQDKLLEKLYESQKGRMILKILTMPIVSKIGGRCLDTYLSKVAIVPFVRKNKIPMEQYEEVSYRSYNDFFTRRIKEEYRPICLDKTSLIAPCDGKVSAYPITKQGGFVVKHTFYTVRSLLRSETLAEKYLGGTALVFRLTVDDYHRYCYPAEGEKTRNYYLKGKFHTVNPIANDYYPIYKENAREYTLLKTKEFGVILQMEVGALMVGKISNYEGKATVKKGQEKGRFEFGGSTIILLLQKDKVNVDSDLLKNTEEGFETIVRLGEVIGKSYLA
ncbi:MAG: phosphatidylserine decarboxylase [Clostridiales bacterium]|nr:phosphatidylserine decarboxylase [Clostridiales bacterium]